MWRFTRLALGFSKKFENHRHMVALYTVWYNFVRCKTLRTTPAMTAGVSDRLWSMSDIVDLIERSEAMAEGRRQSAASRAGPAAPYVATSSERGRVKV